MFAMGLRIDGALTTEVEISKVRDSLASELKIAELGKQIETTSETEPLNEVDRRINTINDMLKDKTKLPDVVIEYLNFELSRNENMRDTLKEMQRVLGLKLVTLDNIFTVYKSQLGLNAGEYLSKVIAGRGKGNGEMVKLMDTLSLYSTYRGLYGDNAFSTLIKRSVPMESKKANEAYKLKNDIETLESEQKKLNTLTKEIDLIEAQVEGIKIEVNDLKANELNENQSKTKQEEFKKQRESKENEIDTLKELQQKQKKESEKINGSNLKNELTQKQARYKEVTKDFSMEGETVDIVTDMTGKRMIGITNNSEFAWKMSMLAMSRENIQRIETDNRFTAYVKELTGVYKSEYEKLLLNEPMKEGMSSENRLKRMNELESIIKKMNDVQKMSISDLEKLNESDKAAIRITIEQALSSFDGVLGKNTASFREVVKENLEEMLKFTESEDINKLFENEELLKSALESITSQYGEGENIKGAVIKGYLELLKNGKEIADKIFSEKSPLEIPEIPELYKLISDILGGKIEIKSDLSKNHILNKLNEYLKTELNLFDYAVTPSNLLKQSFKNALSDTNIKSVLVMEALKVKQKEMTKQRRLLEVEIKKTEIKDTKLQKENELKALIEKENDLINMLLVGEAASYRETIMKHNYLKYELMEGDTRKVIESEFEVRQELLEKLSKELGVEAQFDFEEIIKSLKTDTKGNELSADEKETKLQQISEVLKGFVEPVENALKNCTTPEEAQKYLLENPEQLGKLLTAVNAAIAISSKFASLSKEQLMASYGAFVGSKVLELATGEGKTEVSIAATYLNVMSKYKGLIITTKDFSALDTLSRAVMPLETLLGKSVGCVQTLYRDSKNKDEYKKDVIVAATGKWSFDIQSDLEKAVSAGDRFMGDHSKLAAVIDEWDSVYIHQALTEYIRSSSGKISGPQFDLVSGIAKHLGVNAKRNIEEGKYSEQQLKYIIGKSLVDMISWDVRLEGVDIVKKSAIEAQKEGKLSGSIDVEKETAKHDSSNKLLKNKVGKGGDVVIDRGTRSVELTEQGKAKLLEQAKEFGLLDKVMSFEEIERFVTGQIEIEALYVKGVDYEVTNGRVFLTDYGTGVYQETMRKQGRINGGGGHIALELKEGLYNNLGEDTMTSASMSARNGFKQLGKAAGITGTASQTAKASIEIYGMGYSHIPSHNPKLRIDVGVDGKTLKDTKALPDKYKDLELPIFSSDKETMDYLVESIIKDVREGRPVLLFTDTIQKSGDLEKQLMKFLSERINSKGNEADKKLFEKMGILENGRLKINRYDAKYLHTDNSARTKSLEDNIVENEAGKSGAITIATNIGARGTDFKLIGGAKEKGFHIYGMGPTRGLDIEMQQRGRAGRQGAMGISEVLVSLQSDRGFLEEGLMKSQFAKASDWKMFKEIYGSIESAKDKGLNNLEIKRADVWEAVQRAQELIKEDSIQSIKNKIEINDVKFYTQQQFNQFKMKLEKTVMGREIYSAKLEKIIDSIFKRNSISETGEISRESVIQEVEKLFGLKLEMSDFDSANKTPELLVKITQRLSLAIARAQYENILQTEAGKWFVQMQTIEGKFGGNIKSFEKEIAKSEKTLERNIIERLVQENVQGEKFDKFIDEFASDSRVKFEMENTENTRRAEIDKEAEAKGTEREALAMRRYDADYKEASKLFNEGNVELAKVKAQNAESEIRNIKDFDLNSKMKTDISKLIKDIDDAIISKVEPKAESKTYKFNEGEKNNEKLQAEIEDYTLVSARKKIASSLENTSYVAARESLLDARERYMNKGRESEKVIRENKDKRPEVTKAREDIKLEINREANVYRLNSLVSGANRKVELISALHDGQIQETLSSGVHIIAAVGIAVNEAELMKSYGDRLDLSEVRYIVVAEDGIDVLNFDSSDRVKGLVDDFRILRAENKDLSVNEVKSIYAAKFSNPYGVFNLRSSDSNKAYKAVYGALGDNPKNGVMRIAEVKMHEGIYVADLSPEAEKSLTENKDASIRMNRFGFAAINSKVKPGVDVKADVINSIVSFTDDDKEIRAVVDTMRATIYNSHLYNENIMSSQRQLDNAFEGVADMIGRYNADYKSKLVATSDYTIMKEFVTTEEQKQNFFEKAYSTVSGGLNNFKDSIMSMFTGKTSFEEARELISKMMIYPVEVLTKSAEQLSWFSSLINNDRSYEQRDGINRAKEMFNNKRYEKAYQTAIDSAGIDLFSEEAATLLLIAAKAKLEINDALKLSLETETNSSNKESITSSVKSNNEFIYSSLEAYMSIKGKEAEAESYYFLSIQEKERGNIEESVKLANIAYEKDNKNPVYIKELIQRLEEQAKTEPQGMEGMIQSMMQGKADMTKVQEMMKNNGEEQKKKTEEINNKLKGLYKEAVALLPNDEAFKLEAAEKLMALNSKPEAIEILKSIKAEDLMNKASILRIKTGAEDVAVLKELARKINYDSLNKEDSQFLADFFVQTEDFERAISMNNKIDNKDGINLLINDLSDNLVTSLQKYEVSNDKTLISNINRQIEVLNKSEMPEDIRNTMRANILSIVNEEILFSDRFIGLTELVSGKEYSYLIGKSNIHENTFNGISNQVISLEKQIKGLESSLKNITSMKDIINQIKAKGKPEEIFNNSLQLMLRDMKELLSSIYASYAEMKTLNNEKVNSILMNRYETIFESSMQILTKANVVSHIVEKFSGEGMEIFDYVRLMTQVPSTSLQSSLNCFTYNLNAGKIHPTSQLLIQIYENFQSGKYNSEISGNINANDAFADYIINCVKEFGIKSYALTAVLNYSKNDELKNILMSKINEMEPGQVITQVKKAETSETIEPSVKPTQKTELSNADRKNLMWFTVIVGQLNQSIKNGNVDEIREAWNRQSNVMNNNRVVINHVGELLNDREILNLVSSVLSADEKLNKLLSLQLKAFNMISGSFVGVNNKDIIGKTLVLDLKNRKDISSEKVLSEIMRYYRYSISNNLELKIIAKINSIAWKQLKLIGFKENEHLIGVESEKQSIRDIKRRKKELQTAA
ncbi:MAG: Preprotein translocase, SecA subunit [uncultured bacterium]|nr:MAG: Preprotein translocase, SecA subunit [uncultured bacterium]